MKRRRVRPPRDFGIFNGLQVEEADFIRWREFLVRSHSGKFRGDDLMDIVHHNSKVSAESHICGKAARTLPHCR